MGDGTVNDDRPAIDTQRSAWCGDRFAAVCVHPDGEETFWLMSGDSPDDDDAGCSCGACAPHDQLGELTIPADPLSSEEAL